MRLNGCHVLFFLLLASSAHGTAIIQESIEQMARRTPTIIRGVVVHQASRWDAERRHIETLIDIRVTEKIKGKVGRQITVRIPGGEVNGIGQRVSGAPAFVPGEEVVLFLEPSKKTTHFQVSGLAAGKVTLEQSPLGHHAVRKMEGLEQVNLSREGANQIQVLDREDLGSTEAFLDRVRRAIAPDQEGTR